MILCLLMKNSGVFFNSRNFDLQPVGELAWIKRYLDFNAIDELVLLNVDREAKSIAKFAGHMRELGRFCFVPIAAGGGVGTIADFESLLGSGADKVVVNTAAIRDPEFITRAARVFGSQCVVASIDFRSTPAGNQVFSGNGAIDSGLGVVEWAKEVAERGAGEIFLTSIDRDGCGNGYDLEILKAVADSVAIPVIASGGVGEFRHLAEGIEEGNASAVSAANIFHYIGNGLTNAKAFLGEKGLDFPMWHFM